MINQMNPIPAIIEEIKSDPEIACSTQESESRLSSCKSCENFFIDVDNHTKCKGCSCNISILISLKIKECPLEKW